MESFLWKQKQWYVHEHIFYREAKRKLFNAHDFKQ